MAGSDLGNFGPVVIALLVGALSTAVLFWRRRRTTKATVLTKGKEEEAVKARVKEAIPEDGVFTLKTLEPFDGQGELPICLGVCGKVVDVSSSENIKYGEGYGKLWAGKDATYALATLSLQASDANKLDFKISDFDADQMKALAGWYKHFTTKYVVVGTLQEYKDWDFGAVEELAKSQTPFGAAATAPAPAEAPAKATEKVPEDAVVLSKGATVVVTASQERPELIGKIGVLSDFDAEQRRFKVDMSTGEGFVYFKPDEIAETSSATRTF
mmetsp:Transcript_88183/g.248123  ORF Transcript_88183/g.248123 Transcript_88183/m.248123 type:complete len:270 (+) Transcript_88183:64-873(+)